MIRTETRGDKGLAFVMGLVYGYRNALLNLKVLPLSQFSREEHSEDRTYFINRKINAVFTDPLEGDYTHVCVIREDKENKEVVLFIYK